MRTRCKHTWEGAGAGNVAITARKDEEVTMRGTLEFLFRESRDLQSDWELFLFFRYQGLDVLELY